MPMPDQANTVSVIVPTFNRADLLMETLEAVRQQLRTTDELIIVDDASEDDTPALLSKLNGKANVIRQSRNGGKSAALNAALSVAKKSMVWIVDDDDIVTPDARDRLANALIDNPDAGFSYGRHDRFLDDPETGLRQHLSTGYWVECSTDELLISVMEDMFPHQPGMMVRRSLYQEVGPFRSEFDRSEDYEMLIRLAVAARGVAIPGIVFHQRVHAGTRGSKENPVLATQRDNNWLELGKQIASEVISELPLQLFLPERRLDGKLQVRRAHLQRGVVFARHHLWERAIQEFEAGTAALSSQLEPAETEIVKRATYSKFGIRDLLYDRDTLTRLSSVAMGTDAGKGIASALGQSLKWRIRSAILARDFALAFQAFRAYRLLVSR